MTRVQREATLRTVRAVCAGNLAGSQTNLYDSRFVYWVYIGIMEKKMETTVGFIYKQRERERERGEANSLGVGVVLRSL